MSRQVRGLDVDLSEVAAAARGGRWPLGGDFTRLSTSVSSSSMAARGELLKIRMPCPPALAKNRGDLATTFTLADLLLSVDA